MACVTDPNAPIQMCNLSVIEANFGGPLRVIWTAELVTTIDTGGTDTFTGVVTVVEGGQPIVVATFNHVTVSLDLFNGPTTQRVFMQTHETIPDSWAGKTIHISIGPSSLFDFPLGSIFSPVASAMYRISYTFPPGAPKFTLSVLRLPTVVQSTYRPSMTVLVHNTGTGAGVDTVTATTYAPSGQVVSTWSSSQSPLVPPGSSQPVSIQQLDPPGNEYQGQTLVVVVKDQYGNEARSTYYVPSPSQPTPPSQPPSGSPGVTLPPTTPAPTSLAPILIGIGMVVVGGGLLYLATKRG